MASSVPWACLFIEYLPESAQARLEVALDGVWADGHRCGGLFDRQSGHVMEGHRGPHPRRQSFDSVPERHRLFVGTRRRGQLADGRIKADKAQQTAPGPEGL